MATQLIDAITAGLQQRRMDQEYRANELALQTAQRAQEQRPLENRLAQIALGLRQGVAPGTPGMKAEPQSQQSALMELAALNPEEAIKLQEAGFKLEASRQAQRENEFKALNAYTQSLLGAPEQDRQRITEIFLQSPYSVAVRPEVRDAIARNTDFSDATLTAKLRMGGGKPDAAKPDYRVLRDQSQRYYRVDLNTGEREDLGFSGPTPPPAQGPAPANVTVLGGFTDTQGNPLVLDPRTNTLQLAGQGRVAPGTPPPEIKPAGTGRSEATLRNEYLRETKDYRERVGAYRQIEALSGGGAVNDRALVIALMKVYDPTSVVREGEQAMMSNAGGVPEWVRNTFNKLLNGESLTPEQRAAMVQSARSLVESQRPSFDAATSEYRRLALESGLNPSSVIVETTPQITPQPPPAGAQRRVVKWPAAPQQQR